jgi:hypothetical protein
MVVRDGVGLREGAGALGAQMEAEQLDQAVGQLSYEAAAKAQGGQIMTQSRDLDPAERAVVSTTMGGPGATAPPLERTPGLPQPEQLERDKSRDRWSASARIPSVERSLTRILTVLCVASGAVTHALHLFLYGALGAEMEAEQSDRAVGQLTDEAVAKLKEGRS